MTDDQACGILNVDKPRGWTSHDVVGLVRRLVGQRQVGHAGTLDPLATGVLLVTIGAATRLSDYLMHGRKCYRAGVYLGARTTTDDAEGEVIETRSTGHVTRDAVATALAQHRGEIEQRPPAYAAIKKGGVPAYKLARQGQMPDLAPRHVRIDALALLGMEGDALDLLVWCSAGTYIRALARDLGEALECGAHLSSLRRLSSGTFTVATASGVAVLRELAAQGRMQERIAPLDDAVASWPAIILDDAQLAAVLHGNAFRPGTPTRSGGAIGANARVYGGDGRLVALARYDAGRDLWQPDKVLVAPGTMGRTTVAVGPGR